MTRPTRREAAQLDDLVRPLYAEVSPESKRYAAAALSECATAPPGLVAMLAGEAVDIATPLLLRSTALDDIQLLSIIGRNGAGHARAIARRDGVHPTIVALTGKLVALDPAVDAGAVETAAASHEPPLEEEIMTNGPERPFAELSAEEETRRLLREMMRPVHLHDLADDDRLYRRLRETALTGMPALFTTVLADCFELDFRTAQMLLAPSGYAPLMAALRALGLTAEQAFVIAAAVYPAGFPHPEAIRLFLERYRLLETGEAIERIRSLKADAIHAAANADPVRTDPVRNDNQTDGPAAARLLRAS